MGEAGGPPPRGNTGEGVGRNDMEPDSATTQGAPETVVIPDPRSICVGEAWSEIGGGLTLAQFELVFGVPFAVNTAPAELAPRTGENALDVDRGDIFGDRGGCSWQLELDAGPAAFA